MRDRKQVSSHIQELKDWSYNREFYVAQYYDRKHASEAVTSGPSETQIHKSSSNTAFKRVETLSAQSYSTFAQNAQNLLSLSRVNRFYKIEWLDHLTFLLTFRLFRLRI